MCTVTHRVIETTTRSNIGGGVMVHKRDDDLIARVLVAKRQRAILGDGFRLPGETTWR